MDAAEDRRTFEAQVQEHQRAATAIAARMLGDQDDAEDVVLEALESMYGAGKESPDIPFRDQLFARVRRLARNRRERDQRLERRRNRFAVAMRETAGFVDGEQREMRRLDAATVRHALAALPRMQQRCFALTVIGDYSAEELGAIDGISPVTVRQHAARAQRALRRAFTPGTERRTQSTLLSFRLRSSRIHVRNTASGT